MKREIAIQARSLHKGDEISWDRAERFFWLVVQHVIVVRNLVIIDFALPFEMLEGLGRFHFSKMVYVVAIDADAHSIILQQQNNSEDMLLIRRERVLHEKNNPPSIQTG